MQVGTKFVPGWSINGSLCQRESCGPAPAGKYYLSERTRYDICQLGDCTNAPVGSEYIGGGGSEGLCPFDPPAIINRGGGDDDANCKDPAVGHFFSSEVREELSRLVFETSMHHVHKVGFVVRCVQNGCATEMCPPLTGKFYFSPAKVSLAGVREIAHSCTLLPSIPRQDRAGCAQVRAPCTNAKPGEQYTEPSTPVLSADSCPVRKCEKEAPTGEYYVRGGDCTQKNRAPCTKLLGKYHTTNGRGLGKPNGCVYENCTISAGDGDALLMRFCRVVGRL